jgi:hypothetical protein
MESKRDRARAYEAARNAVIKAAREWRDKANPPTRDTDLELIAGVDHLNSLRKINE